jgi:hypothetical protein
MLVAGRRLGQVIEVLACNGPVSRPAILLARVLLVTSVAQPSPPSRQRSKPSRCNIVIRSATRVT